jgi:UDP-N-acetylglucosamine acyltransferase
MTEIHETAIIGKSVELGKDVKIGPYAIIRDNVNIGDRVQIDSHALICEETTIGADSRVFHSAVVGEVNQDLKYKGEKTATIIGERTNIREFVTIHRGTDDKWKTVVGNDCLLMAYVHVAHDVEVGNNVILANSATLAGHVVVDDFAIIGGLVGVHQFVKIGKHVMIGGGFRCVKDVPPRV